MESASIDQNARSPDSETGRVDSSNVLVNEGLLTPSQPSFSAAITSPPAPPRGAYGLLLFVLSLDLGVADLTVTQISSPVYRGAVTYIRTLLDTGDIARVYPEVPRSVMRTSVASWPRI